MGQSASALKAPDGMKGQDGLKGPDGDKGPVGDKGPIGDSGLSGSMISQEQLMYCADGGLCKSPVKVWMSSNLQNKSNASDSEISNDVSTLKALALFGNSSSGLGRQVKVFDDLIVDRNSTVKGNQLVSGTSEFTGNAMFSGQTVTGNQLVKGTSEFTGNAMFSGQTVTGNQLVKGTSEFTGNAMFSGNKSVKGTSEFTGNAMFLGNQTVKGISEFTGDSTFIGNSRVNGNQKVIGNSSITGTSAFTGASTFTGPAAFTGDSTFSTATVTTNASILGNATVGGKLILPGTNNSLTADTDGMYLTVNGKIFKFKNDGSFYSPGDTVAGGNVKAGLDVSSTGTLSVGGSTITTDTGNSMIFKNKNGKQMALGGDATLYLPSGVNTPGDFVINAGGSVSNHGRNGTLYLPGNIEANEIIAKGSVNAAYDINSGRWLQLNNWKISGGSDLSFNNNSNGNQWAIAGATNTNKGHWVQTGPNYN